MSGIDGLRAAVRPMLLFILALGSLIIVLEGIETPYSDEWVYTFFIVLGEWVAERPVLKVIKKNPPV